MGLLIAQFSRNSLSHETEVRSIRIIMFFQYCRLIVYA